MQLVPSRQVREGQTIARDVRNMRGEILLSQGQRLTTSLIARLYKFSIEAVYIRDGFGENEPELVKSEMRQKCLEVLDRPLKSVAQETKKKCLNLDAHAIQAASENLIDSLLGNRNPLITLLDVSTGSGMRMQHAVNSAVLAITLAIDLNIPVAMITHLASAMLFHDIGMMYLPDELLEKTGKLTPQEIQKLRTHAQLGFEHLVQANAVSTVAANIVLRHHEMVDGSGYPGGIGGDKLSLLMRIAAIAELYDSMTSIRPYAAPVMPDAALSYILVNTGTRFSRDVVLALSRRVALYPTGTAVQLNTGEAGIVAGTQRDLPTRPALHIHFDHKGRKMSAPVLIELTKDRARAVVRSAPSIQALQQNGGAPMRLQVDPVYASLG